MLARRRLPASNFPHHIEHAYRRLLLARVDALHQLVRGEVLDAMRQRPDIAERARRDSSVEEDVSAVRAALRQAASEARERDPIRHTALLELGARVDHHVQRQLERQLARVSVVDPEFELAGEAWLEAFTERNVELIRSLDARYLEDVRGVIEEGIRQGQPLDQVAGALEERAGVSASRANVIARDQVATAGRQLTEQRHRELGISEYEWHTAGDDRVRQACARNDGQVFAWEEGDGGEHPGDRINCRCQAIPVVDLDSMISP